MQFAGIAVWMAINRAINNRLLRETQIKKQPPWLPIANGKILRQ